MTQASPGSNTHGPQTTPATLRSQLLRLGHDVTERALVDWRDKGLLPPLERTNGRRTGRGPTYVWSEPDVLLQAHTLCVSLEQYRRTDYALLFTWFAGFNYDERQVRQVWHETTERGWRSSLEFLAGEPFKDEDLQWVLDELRVPSGRESTLRTVFVKARLVPDLDRLPIRVVQQAFEEFCARAHPGARDQLRNSFKPEAIQSFVHLYNQELAPVAWKKRIGACSASDLWQAHDDLEFLFRINRWTLRRIVNDVLVNGADRQLALRMFPSMMSWSGWLLLMLDLLLRSHGMHEEVQATASLLNRPTIHHIARMVIMAGEQENRRGVSDPNESAARLVEHLKHDVVDDPELDSMRSDIGAIAEALTLLWKGKVLRLLAIVNCTVADRS